MEKHFRRSRDVTTTDENGNRQIRHKLLIVLPTMAVIAVGTLYLFGYFQTRMVALHPEADEFEAHTEAASGQLDPLEEPCPPRGPTDARGEDRARSSRSRLRLRPRPDDQARPHMCS